jgi:hypothetical protein
VDLDGRRDDSPVQLVLDPLELEVADQDPGQQPAEEQADGDDAGGGRQEA